MATVPMSIVMERLYRQLPPQEQYPLPPNQIVNSLMDDKPSSSHQVITFTGHFAYGAGTGAVYALLFDKLPAPRLIKGIVFGLGVWFVSYQGWLPAFRILPPATHQPGRRNLLMIVAHIVWGGALGLIAD